MKPIVRNINTGDLYSWDGKEFKNIRTGVSGAVSDNAAKRTFKINIEATEIINEYPIVAEMINRLGLKFEK